MLDYRRPLPNLEDLWAELYQPLGKIAAGRMPAAAERASFETPASRAPQDEVETPASRAPKDKVFGVGGLAEASFSPN